MCSGLGASPGNPPYQDRTHRAPHVLDIAILLKPTQDNANELEDEVRNYLGLLPISHAISTINLIESIRG